MCRAVHLPYAIAPHAPSGMTSACCSADMTSLTLPPSRPTSNRGSPRCSRSTSDRTSGTAAGESATPRAPCSGTYMQPRAVRVPRLYARPRRVSKPHLVHTSDLARAYLADRPPRCAGPAHPGPHATVRRLALAPGDSPPFVALHRRAESMAGRWSRPARREAVAPLSAGAESAALRGTALTRSDAATSPCASNGTLSVLPAASALSSPPANALPATAHAQRPPATLGARARYRCSTARVPAGW
jgi:hypothetical protein